MKKNIFFVVFLLLILLSAGLYFITEYVYKDRLTTNINSLKENPKKPLYLLLSDYKPAFYL